MHLETYFQIEELIPAENAIGGKEYWVKLIGHYHGSPFRTYELEDATKEFKRLKKQKRIVRLVKITEECVNL